MVGCADFQELHLNRRTILTIGGLGLAGLTQANLLRAEAISARRPATAKSVILLFQFGGPSHIDTFDPKPHAPEEVRGEFKTIRTKVPGIHITEHLPKMAQIADKFSLVRSVSHKTSSHNPAAYYALVGREPLINRVTLNASATDFPHPGSIVDYLDRRPSPMPASVALPTMIADGPFRTPGEFAGFLGKKYDPLWVLRNPNAADFRVEELSLPGQIDVTRIGNREKTLGELDKLSRLTDKIAAVKGMNEYRARAIELLTSPATKHALDIHREPDKVRERYGRTTYGQSVLLARRLVEAGVRFVTVYFSRGIRGWDQHSGIFPTLKNGHLPKTDQTVPALLEDLDERGLLDETLVYWTGDFGRTPQINSKAGRDHWPSCQTVLLAGGGIQGGRVYGASGPHGGYPKVNPSRPEDITATLFHTLGLDPETIIRDQLDRPTYISTGKPIGPLLA